MDLLGTHMEQPQANRQNKRCSMDLLETHLEQPQANRQNKYRARPRPGRALHNIPRQFEQLHINEGGKQLGEEKQHDQRAGEPNAQRIRRQRDQRPGGRQQHGAGRNGELREGEHLAGRRLEQVCESIQCGTSGQKQRHDRKHKHNAGGQNGRGGSGHHGQRSRVEHEPRTGDWQDHRWRRANFNQDRRGNLNTNIPQRPLQNRDPVRRQKEIHLMLEELLENKPSQVAITLAAHPRLKDILSDTEMKPDLVELLCKVLCKACTARLPRQSIQYSLGQVKSSAYFRICLPHYIVGIITEPVPEKKQHYPDNIQNIISLLREIICIFPASGINETSMVMTVIPASINALRASGVEVVNDIEQNLERVSHFIQLLQERKREGKLKVDTRMVLDPEISPDDFRFLSVYPTHDEIHLNAKPFLRANTLKQKFETTAIYLDTHFRLLREDFVRPLREGIQDILQYLNDGSIDKPTFDDIRVYFGTQIISPVCILTGIAYNVKFDVKPLKWVRWQNSKRLLYGSLVCLSKDHFESFLFATVSNRDDNKLAEGEVQLQFAEQSKELLARACPTDSYIMVETTAFFEAYRHVLEGLKEMNIQEVPFQKHIVLCEKDVAAPRYLNASSQYNLRCILNKDEGTVSNSMNKINILNPTEWPSKESLGLDESQMEAVQLALTKELAIIQGPPGTGKTYVGLKIAQALLTNADVWQMNGLPRPILVVCYTNHALDQFLEGILKFLIRGIVRVGGRSSSEVLKELNLSRLMREPKGYEYEDIKYTQMKPVEEKIQEAGVFLKCSTAGIIHEKYLNKYIKKEHWDTLHRRMDAKDFFYTFGRGEKSMLVEWLGLSFLPCIPTEADPHPDLKEWDEEKPQGEKLIDIKEVAHLMHAQRELYDEDEYERELRKRIAEERNKELERNVLAFSFNDTQEAGVGWEITKDHKKKIKQRIKSELRKLDAMTEAEADQIRDVWGLDLNARWRLYRYWIQHYQQNYLLTIMNYEKTYQKLADRLTELNQTLHSNILQRAKVIGMTTTGAARYRHVLQEVQPRIVIVEEAAEVLEAHIITALSSACQHLVLIGDHQQLRPSANVYELAKTFNLEVSLFERLIQSELPYVRLNYQHRMRPEIAQLLTPHIYKELENHPSVLHYENIKGVASNLYFVNHNFSEENIKDGKSHQNLHEAKFIVELCKYLLHQGYQPSQITILTTYTGQLLCFRNLMPAKRFSGVNVHVVDNYQGEENDIILLSLVRSNKEGKVGFLNIPNRVCVALSRAKKALYCIGNMEMLSSVRLWSHILGTLKQKEQVGSHLILSCQNHPDIHTCVSSNEDFKSVPEGGCNKKCAFQLNCGHICTLMCHPYDQEHKEFQCMKNCEKVCMAGHKCKLKCFQPCGACMVKVEKIIPSCGHKQMVPCSISESKFICTIPCNKMLHCGHPCEKHCGEDCDSYCPKPVDAELKCGHVQQIKCWQKRDLKIGEPVRCRHPCSTMLSCGHTCSGSCESCFDSTFHEGCRQPCKTVLVCSHECQSLCSSECSPCERPCQNRCVHRQCKKKCGESCVPCMEPCNWSCQHYKCNRLCSEPCDRPPCNLPCEKQLTCGHSCVGLCGEPCPNMCSVCNKDEISELSFGFEDEDDARFVQLEDCKHIIEYKSMDTYMAGQHDSEEGIGRRLKECPKCKMPIRKNLRYGTVINKTLSEIEKVKERIAGLNNERNETRKQLRRNLREMTYAKIIFNKDYKKLEKQLEYPLTPLRTLQHIENIMLFYEKLAKLFSHMNRLDDKENDGLKKRLLEIKKWLDKTRSFFTQQELSDLNAEVERYNFLLKLLAKRGKWGTAPKYQIIMLRETLESSKKFTDAN